MTTYETWLRTQRGETMKTTVEAADAIDAIDATLKRFNLDRSELKDVRITEKRK